MDMMSYLHVILYNFSKLKKTMLYDHKLVGPPDFPVGPLFLKYLGECFAPYSTDALVAKEKIA